MSWCGGYLPIFHKKVVQAKAKVYNLDLFGEKTEENGGLNVNKESF